jgi:hypothetical protein
MHGEIDGAVNGRPVGPVEIRPEKNGKREGLAKGPLNASGPARSAVAPGFITRSTDCASREQS